MRRIWNRAPAVFVAAVVAGVAITLGACGGDGSGVTRHEQPPETVVSGGGASLSSVAPNTFLTYEGRRYRLVDLYQADLVDQDGFQRVGTATAADIDQDDLTVFQRDGDAEAVYTYARERAESEADRTVEGTDATTPALWYRWAPE